MLSLSLRVVCFTLAILGPFPLVPIPVPLTLSHRCPSDLARLHPFCLRHWGIMGSDPLLRHSLRP
jgi:hypothetical protein